MDVLIWIAILGIITGLIGHHKGRNFWAWWIFGAAMFIVALPVALLLKKTPEKLAEEKAAEGRVPCPHCAEWIPAQASICGYCQTPLRGPPVVG